MKVIAISGVSGCGKTSVIKQLSQALSCPYLLFDDYCDEYTYPKDMQAWFAAGADVTEIKTPEFTKAISRVKATSDKSYLFIEEPFGRQRKSMASLIDAVILLDQPMEVCLSRVILRNIKGRAADPLSAITRYLTKYNHYFREIYIGVNRRTRESSDFIINDVACVESIADVIDGWLKHNFD